MGCSNKMRKLIVIILIVVLLLGVAVIFDIVPPVFWSFKSFLNPNYSSELEKEWMHKTSSFLLLKLHSIDSMRFGLAAYLLGQRKDAKAISSLVDKVRSNFIDNQIHFSACSALAQISPEIAKNILTELVEKYRKSKLHRIPDHKSPEYQRYKNALHILSTMKDESVYPICLQMAKSGDRLEKESSLNGMLYYFDNHWEEVLPLYVKYLNDKNSSDIASINGIKNMKRPEAIPALEEFASRNSTYAKDAEAAILYLRGLEK